MHPLPTTYPAETPQVHVSTDPLIHEFESIKDHLSLLSMQQYIPLVCTSITSSHQPVITVMRQAAC